MALYDQGLVVFEFRYGVVVKQAVGDVHWVSTKLVSIGYWVGNGRWDSQLASYTFGAP